MEDAKKAEEDAKKSKSLVERWEKEKQQKCSK